MKKNLILILVLMSFLLTPSFIYAGGKEDDKKIVSGCKDVKDVGCAFCVYSYTESFPQTSQKGCSIKFSVTYKGDSTPLKYETYYTSNGNLTGGSLNCSYQFKFKKNDFVKDDNKLECPKISADYKMTSSGGRSANYDYTFSKKKDSKLSPTDESEVKGKAPEKKEKSRSCRYDQGACGGYTISYIDGTTQIMLDNQGAKKIVNQLDSTLFKDSCPEQVYTYYNNRGENSCYFSTTGNSRFEENLGYEQNENTGDEADNEYQLYSPSVSDMICQSLLGNPDTNGTPAFYISMAFNVLKYVAIILLIVMSVMDFVGAIASQDNDILKKAMSKVIIRAILCVVIFILPTIIDFVLQFINDSALSDCL